MRVEEKEEDEVAAQILCDQEIFADVLMALLAEPGGDLRVGEQVANLVGRAFDRMREEAGVFVDYLNGDSADGAGHYGLLLPQLLGDG